MKWTKARKRIYMREYMRRYYKKNRKKILARSQVLRNLRKLRQRIKARKAAPKFLKPAIDEVKLRNIARALAKELAPYEEAVLIKGEDPAVVLARAKAESRKVTKRVLARLVNDAREAVPVPAGPWSRTCPVCGTLNLDPSRPCRRCGPDSEKHLPPSPPQSQRIPSGRPAHPRLLEEDENDQTVAKEAGF